MQKEQKTIIQIYAAYFLSLICNVIPSSAVQTFGLLLFIVIFVATYIYKNKAEGDSLTYSHMAFIIKSIWVSSLILFVGMIAAYILADHSIVHSTFNSIKQGLFLTEEQLNGLIIDYFKANIFVFTSTLGPSFIYLAYRLIKGVVFAKNNTPIANLKSWF